MYLNLNSTAMIERCVIIDNNTSRSAALEKALRENKISSNIKHTLNCGHGLVYLKEIWENIQNQQALVIMNVHTPIMNGIEFMDELKDTPYSKTKNLMLVAMNDTLDEIDKNKFIEKGITSFINSPFSKESLTDILKDKFTYEETEELSIPEKVQPSFTEKKTKNKNRR
jgi:CheY-like chemotaxis protein